MFPLLAQFSTFACVQSLILLVFAATLTLPAASNAFQIPSAMTPPAQSTRDRDTPQLRDSSNREGPFTIDGRQYSVLYTYKVLQERTSPSAPAAKSSSTLTSVQLLDSHGTSFYQQTFPYTVTQQRFVQTLSATSSLLPGNGGTALIIRFLERSATSADAPPEPAKESWQVFTFVNGQFTPLGAVLPLGHGQDITTNGAVAAVMMRGGIAVMPMASTAEVLAFRAWTGGFYAMVPVRFDWAHGQWGEGQQCYQTANGTLTERGCIMPVEAKPQPRSPDADPGYVRLFVAPDGNTGNLQNLSIDAGARIEILEMQAIVRWETRDNRRIACSFRNLWLRVRINDQEGWVQGQDAFDALGLPVTSPQ